MTSVIYEDPFCVVEQERGNIPTVRGRGPNEPQQVSLGVLTSAGQHHNVEVFVRFDGTDYRLTDYNGSSWLATPEWYGICFNYFEYVGLVFSDHEDHVLQSRDLDVLSEEGHVVRCLTCDEYL